MSSVVVGGRYCCSWRAYCRSPSLTSVVGGQGARRNGRPSRLTRRSRSTPPSSQELERAGREARTRARTRWIEACDDGGETRSQFDDWRRRKTRYRPHSSIDLGICPQAVTYDISYPVVEPTLIVNLPSSKPINPLSQPFVHLLHRSLQPTYDHRCISWIQLYLSACRTLAFARPEKDV
jgi:hypothetical protein